MPAPLLRVLIVKLSSLGDVVHAMPVVHDIRKAHPGARIDWVSEPGFATMLRRVEGVNDVIECALRRWRGRWWSRDVHDEARDFLARLRRERYDAVLDLQGLTKSALIARFARCTPDGLRYGLGNRTEGAGWEPPAKWLADRAIQIEPHTHALDRSRILAAKALNYPLQGPPVFGLRAAASRSRERRSVVLVHGTSRADKLWPERNWIQLGRRLVDDGWQIELPQGNEEEEVRAERLAEGIGASHCQVWPRMNLGLLIDRMGSAQGVIGVDSGPSHIAVALNLPHVQIYNFPTAWRTGPQAEHGHSHQVSVGGDQVPTLDEVWFTWQRVMAVTA